MGFNQWPAAGCVGQGADVVPRPAYRSVSIGGGAATIELPAHFSVESGGDGTVLASVPGDGTATFRASALTFRAKNGLPAKEAGANYCRRIAQVKGLESEDHEGRVVVHEVKPFAEEGIALTLDSWTVGGDEVIAILTVTTEISHRTGPAATELFSAMKRIVGSLSFHETVEVVEISGQAMAKRISKREAPLQQFEALSTSEEAWLEAGLLHASALGRRYLSSPSGCLSPVQLDQVFSRWVADGSPDRPAAEIVAVGVGASLGDHLVRTGGMRWGRVTDEQGTALVVQHGRGSTTAFPFESVRRRIETGQTRFVANLAAVIAEQIRAADEPN